MIRRLAVALLVCARIASAADYITTVNADSPVDFWYFDEPSGVTATDHAAAARNLTYVASPTLGAAGQITGHTAVTWNGSTQYASIAPVTAADWNTNSHDMTWECWVNFSSVASAGSPISLVNDPDNGACGGSRFRAWYMFAPHSGSSGKAQMGLASNTDCSAYMTATGTTVLATSTWYQIVGRFTKATPRTEVLVNAVVEGNTTTTSATLGNLVDNSTLRAGTFWNAGVISSPMTGSEQMCSIYTTALTDARVLAHYNAGITAPANAWPFTVKLDRLIRPDLLLAMEPAWRVNEPSFVVERLNRRAIRSPSQYEFRRRF